MESFWDKVVKALAAIVGFIAGLFGGWQPLMTLLIVANALDFAMGLMCGAMGKSQKTVSGRISSNAAFDGLLKKATMWGIIILAHLVDTAAGNTSNAFQMAALIYYLAVEGISILEKAGLMGVPLPPFIKDALEAMAKQAGASSKPIQISVTAQNHSAISDVHKAQDTEQNSDDEADPAIAELVRDEESEKESVGNDESDPP